MRSIPETRQMQRRQPQCEHSGGKELKEVPIWEKSNLTLQEAAAYSGIGVNKLRELSDEKGCKFVLWNGNKRLIKRKELDKFTESSFSI